MELYEGSVEEGILIFSDSFEEKGRIVESFVIEGDGRVRPDSASFRATPRLVGLAVSISLCLWQLLA